MEKEKGLQISESFYSVQCEGITTGVPSYFVRLTGCNLSCGMSTAMLLKGKKEGFGDPGNFKGDLHAVGKATWTCDTIPVWVKGSWTTNEDFYKKLQDTGKLDSILNGEIHFIWTGGEPTIPQHVKSITSFLKFLTNRHPKATPFSEIETNGTLVVADNDFYGTPYTQEQSSTLVSSLSSTLVLPHRYINQINCSAKLSNSGMPKNRRINPKAIQQIMQHPNYWFKFVVSTEDDIFEFQNDYELPFNIPQNRIIIMPGVDCRADMAERTRWLFEMSKKFGYRGITRSHILAWDKVTGV